MDHTPYALRELVKAIYIEAPDKAAPIIELHTKELVV